MERVGFPSHAEDADESVALIGVEGEAVEAGEDVRTGSTEKGVFLVPRVTGVHGLGRSSGAESY